MKTFSIFLMFAITSMLSVQAQINVPQPSPLGSVSQKVGLTDISITYSRPSIKNRVIFGDLVPFGEMWRLGANASTKLNISSDVTIEGHEVPAGEYALYAIPNAASWTIIIHKNTTYWGTGDDKYTTDEDLVRFDVPVTAYPIKVETMTFDISDVLGDQCNIEFKWENTKVSMKVNTNADAKVMAEIDEKMKGVSSATYYQAARYYLDNNKDMNKALEWINLSLADNDKFWVHRQKALILAKLERYPEAIVAAQKSKDMAAEAKNNDYVRMNEKSIEEWSKMKPATPATPAKKKK